MALHFLPTPDYVGSALKAFGQMRQMMPDPTQQAIKDEQLRQMQARTAMIPDQQQLLRAQIEKMQALTNLLPKQQALKEKQEDRLQSALNLQKTLSPYKIQDAERNQRMEKFKIIQSMPPEARTLFFATHPEAAQMYETALMTDPSSIRDTQHINISQQPVTPDGRTGLVTSLMKPKDEEKIDLKSPGRYIFKQPAMQGEEFVNAVESNLNNMNFQSPHGFSPQERYQLGLQIAANKKHAPPGSQKRLGYALSMEKYLANPEIRNAIADATKFAGAAGQTQASIQSWRNNNPKAYQNYLKYGKVIIPTLTNMTKALENLGATDRQRDEITRTVDAVGKTWANNPARALDLANFVLKNLSTLAHATSAAAQPIVPGALEKSIGLNTHFVPIGAGDMTSRQVLSKQPDKDDKRTIDVPEDYRNMTVEQLRALKQRGDQ